MSKNDLNQKIYLSIKQIVKNGPKDLHIPKLGNKEIQNLNKCIKKNMVSSVGSFTYDFENKIRKLTKAKHAIAVTNGTCALHLCLHLLGVNENHEVLMPALNFIASANAVSALKAEPHFIDSQIENLGINVNKLNLYLKKILVKKNGVNYNRYTKKRIKVLMITHIFGHPCNLDEIIKLAKKFNLLIVEDAAEGIGSFYKKKHVGTFGIFGVLSFNGNKTITTGGGGVILTNNNKLGNLAKHISNTAKIPHKWRYKYSHSGFNYRMPNINAALGCAQLENLSKFIRSKRKLYVKYSNKFKKINEVSLMKEPQNCKSNYWLQTLILNRESLSFRNKILNFLNNKGYKVRPVWDLINKNRPYLKCQKMDLVVANRLEKKLINLPSSSIL
jgi:aminotransferase in exopolysaccharide biosynthesis